ncbi:MAG: HAD family hydrolase [Chloroflexi bacterium]|nr:HAD family hydrolase [Chloroflexota bacterium]
MQAAFFDVGDTLVEHWAPAEVMSERMRARVCAELGEPQWIDELIAADLEPVPPLSLVQGIAAGFAGPRFEPEHSRQETDAWYRRWFTERGIDVTGIDLDRLRSLMCVPLAEISTPVPGAFESLKWCADRGMRVVLVTNTLSRGDAEVLQDWESFGLDHAIHGVVSSHSVGWRKPHPRIFERALAIAEAAPSEAFHVGDNLIADVYGAQQLGMRAVWRRTQRDPAVRPTERPRPSGRPCMHPSDGLTLRGGDVICLSCDRPPGVEVRPDAIIDDLTELPAVVEPWLA